MANSIAAIPTQYKGITFRSRMEARWAVFMDAMGVPYEYEPEGFQLGELRYLPDFYLPLQDAFLEVKNPTADAIDYEKIDRLVMATQKNVFVFSSGPNVPNWDFESAYLKCYIPPGLDLDGAPHHGALGEDHGYSWCECPHCGRCEIQFNGRADRIGCKCPRSWHGDKGYNFDSPRLIKAHQLARGFRFEEQAAETMPR
jgi:hypothetical protein